MRADIGIYFALVGIVLPVASTVKAFRSPSWRQMKRWATDAGVTITENNEDMIRQRLGRARRYRSVASLPFWWLFFLPILDDRSQFGWAGMWAWIPLTACALGSMLAGASDLGPADGTRTALLAPRVPSRYVWAPARFAPWALLGLSGLFFALAKMFPPRLPVSVRAAIPQFVVAVLAAGLAELVIRLVASRPQPATTPSRIDADDVAIHRRHRRHRLSNSGLGDDHGHRRECPPGAGPPHVDRSSPVDCEWTGHVRRSDRHHVPGSLAAAPPSDGANRGHP